MRICLYFDSVILNDPYLLPVTQDWKSFCETVEQGRFEAFIELLLHLREIGAQPFLSFRPKPSFHYPQLGEIAEELGVSSIESTLESLVDVIIEECEINIVETLRDGHMIVEVGHSDFSTGLGFHIRNDGNATPEEVRRGVGKMFLSEVASYLLADVAASRHTRGCLGNDVNSAKSTSDSLRSQGKG